MYKDYKVFTQLAIQDPYIMKVEVLTCRWLNALQNTKAVVLLSKCNTDFFDTVTEVFQGDTFALKFINNQPRLPISNVNRSMKKKH